MSCQYCDILILRHTVGVQTYTVCRMCGGRVALATMIEVKDAAVALKATGELGAPLPCEGTSFAFPTTKDWSDVSDLSRSSDERGCEYDL